MPRILITGGAGFLGSHLCETFIENGYHVICMDNLITGSPENIAHLMGNETFRFIHHDVTEYMPFCISHLLHLPLIICAILFKH